MIGSEKETEDFNSPSKFSKVPLCIVLYSTQQNSLFSKFSAHNLNLLYDRFLRDSNFSQINTYFE